jgi:signal transduction histidine kinase
MGAIICAIVLITMLYREIPSQWVLQSKVIQYLYFLPIVIAGLWYGWRGGFAAALATVAIYLPGILLWRNQSASVADQYGEALDLLLTGSVLGFLADRERRKTHELELANQRLRASFEKLRQSERMSAVGQLAANLAHEIRNPLAGIEGAADLLGAGTLNRDTQVEFTNIIRKESRRLSKLLSELLDFARPRSPEFVTTSVDQLIHSVVALVGPTALKEGIELREDLAPGVKIHCDPSQIQQVVLNLVMNAIQASTSPSDVTVRTHLESGQVIIDVLDQGSGISPSDRDQLFTPFFTTKTGGMGLGLPIAQQIVGNHGGRISVAENQPKGTIFTISLPERQEPNDNRGVTNT